jgi:hypothetical protein
MEGERGQVCGTVRVACVYVHSAYCRASNRSKQWWGDQEKGEEEREERWVEGGREERRGGKSRKDERREGWRRRIAEDVRRRDVRWMKVGWHDWGESSG